MQHYQLHQEKIEYFIVLIGTIFLITINMCDHGRTITHLQISRFHTQVWYNANYSMKPSFYLWDVISIINLMVRILMY